MNEEKVADEGYKETQKQRANKTAFNWLLVKRVVLVLRNSFVYFPLRYLILLLIMFGIFSLAEQVLISQLGKLNGEFYFLLESKDTTNQHFYVNFLGRTGITLFGIVSCMTIVTTLSSIISLLWRKSLTSYLHCLYFSSSSTLRSSPLYYLLNQPLFSNHLDNVDQRFTSEISSMTTLGLKLLNQFVTIPYQIIYYSYRSYVIIGIYGLGGIYAFFVFGWIISKIIVGPVLRAVVLKERAEGSFRWEHSLVRQKNEEIAFAMGDEKQREICEKKITKVVSRTKSLILRQFFLYFTENTCAYMSTIINFTLISIPILITHQYRDQDSGAISRIISESSFNTLYVIAGWTGLIAMFSNFSEFGGYVTRVAELLEEMKNDSNHPSAQDEGTERTHLITNEMYETEQGSSTQQDVVLRVTDLNCAVRRGKKQLVNNLHLILYKGESLLIMGPSGSGKSSILRVIRGIWQSTAPAQAQREQSLKKGQKPSSPSHKNKITGEIEIGVDNKNLMFVSQQVYIFKSTMSELVYFPKSRIHYEDQEEWKENLRHVEMSEEIIEAEGRQDWSKILSPGERQKVAMSRILQSKPRLVFLDEVTSQVSSSLEEKFYETLKREMERTRLGGMGWQLDGYVSVGHRESLKQYHDWLLTLDGFGGWELTRVQEDIL
eukprot:TRINITY_DN1768_c0_g1_i1.p1 TRINITY_DN1768_c0_g1~~TRINITY_DN1768_c0_g1_i1.p1  ORF type:complete len:668 (-),score=118.28 TRINITY_DN1768_c0_g1_i1:31-2013(-)